MRAPIEMMFVASVFPASYVFHHLYEPDIPTMLLWLVVWYGAVAAVFMEKEKK